MKILMIGSGGREHALIKKLLESPKCTKLYCAPGNGGISRDAELVNIGVMDKENMVKFAKDNAIDLVFVAPDDPLADGMVDAMQEAGIRAFGPNANAAIIEASYPVSTKYCFQSHTTVVVSVLVISAHLLFIRAER